MRLLPIRLFALSLTVVPALCQAIGWESCRVEGKLTEKVVRLDYIEDRAYGNRRWGIYGYCLMTHEGESNSPTKMACAANKGDQPKVSYKSVQRKLRDGTWDSIYVCTAGCSDRTVKEFRTICEDGA